MSDGPSIKGERQEIKAGLFSISCVADNGRLIAFWNSTKDLQFNVTLELTEPNVKALGETKVQDNKYAISIYPGETKECVSGKWKSLKRTLSFGSPDAAWQAQQAAAHNEAIEAEAAEVKRVLKEFPKADGKYTAEYIAGVCAAQKVPFIDLTFPPRQSSIAREFEPKLSNSSTNQLAWMRPATYCQGEAPCLYVGAIEPNDIDQGQLGDCYFLCALACVSEFPALVKGIFAAPQEPELGIYRARLCKNGWWQTVTVDDVLPINASTKLPAFAKNREEPNELWVSLLEKAYAKLHGSYVAIKSGDPAQAIADLIGGPYEKLKDRPEWGDKEALFELLRKCDEEDALMALGTPGTDRTDYGGGGSNGVADQLSDKYQAVGLCTGHAFSLIRVKRLKSGERLCMIRNPWGNDKEWNGAWSDNSPLWTDALKAEVDFQQADDGTFWMSWDDVLQWFDSGSITYPLKTWNQVRVAANLEKGIPDIVLQLEVIEPVRCWFGMHQRDNRGLPTADKDRNYVGLLLAVLQQRDELDAVSKLCASGKGAFQQSRDVFCDVVLQPTAAAKKSFVYVLGQSFGDDDKSFTLSFFVEKHSAVKVTFVAYDDEKKKKYNPVTQFVPSTCRTRVAANYQLLTPDILIHKECQGETVNWSEGAAAKPEPKSAVKAAAPRGKDESTARSPPAAAPPPKGVGAPPVARRKLCVTVLLGRNLVSKDSNGFSDPFVTLTLQDKDGKAYKGVDEVSTKYINKTLNPVWGETFHFDVLPHDRILCQCWDKDVFGKDAMGQCTVDLAKLALAPGGPAVVDYFPLAGDDATGDVQLVLGYG